MNCNEYENLITEYLENKCTPDQCIQMESHLSGCKKCHELAEQERLVMEKLIEIPIEPCPDEIIASVMESIPGHSMSLMERIRSWFQPAPPIRYGAVSLAGSLVILMLVLFLYIPGQQRQSIDSAEYSPEQIQRAATEAKLALAYFSVYSRKTETALEKLNVLEPVIKPVDVELKKAISKIPYI